MSAEEKIKAGIIFALDKIPDVGELFGLIVEEVWPEAEKEDVWGEIKERVEQLLNDKISDLVYGNIKDSLKGLQANSAEYAQALRDSPDNVTYITEKFNVAKGDFNQQAPHFRAEGYELLLLPLFAQMANLHLALLRDGVTQGKAWNWTDKIVADLKRELTSTIDTYTKYVDNTYNAGLAKRKATATNIVNGGGPGRYTDSFNVVNAFVREMTMSVLDYRQMWPYMDLSAYPRPIYVLLTREVYSDALGPSHNPIVPRPEPTGKLLTSCRIRQGNKIDSVTPTYNGVEMPPMGGDGGFAWTDLTWVPATMGQITNYSVHAFDAIWGLAFKFEHQPDVSFLGDYKSEWWESRRQALPEGHYLSSIYATPDPMTRGNVDLVRSIVFGFKLQRTPIFDLPSSPDPKTFSPDLAGVLISSGFAAAADVQGKSLDEQRKCLISVLARYLKPTDEHFKGLSNYDLMSTGAALGLLRLVNCYSDETLKSWTEDDVHNGIIVAIGNRIQPLPLPWLQSLNNLELSIMARGLA